MTSYGNLTTDSTRCVSRLGYFWIKRLLDIGLSLAALMLLIPPFFVIVATLKLSSRGPVFFPGTRIGRNGKPFQMLKFRTMIPNADKVGGSSTPEDDPRITPIGKFLRRYKLDELPQLVNVLRGEMSFVGPRPQVEWAVRLYTEEQKALLKVRPGITDYASLRFRNEAGILRGSKNPDQDYLEKIAPEKIRLGLEYAKTQSLWEDLKIILATAGALFGFSPDWVFEDKEVSK